MNRRDFLKSAAAGLAAAHGVARLEAADAGNEAKTEKKMLAKRPLGQTGEKLSIIGFGGIVVSGLEQEAANELVREAVEKGVNYFDVAPTYGNAEERLGPALEPYRERVFLACKTVQRQKEGAAAELKQSLERLRTDHFDLYQLHGLTQREDLETALGPAGAMEAFLEAREKGQIRFIGFSAHSAEVALEAMDRFDFDTVLFPINFVTTYQANFGPQVIQKAKEKGMGRLALKAMARQPWPEGAERVYPKCWYQPTSDPQEAALALRFTLSEPITAAIPPGDERLFRLALDLALDFQPLSDPERETVRQLAAQLKPIFQLAA